VTPASLPASDASDSLTLQNMAENLFDSVSSAEAAGGDTEYRALMVRNDSAYTMSNVKVWLESNTPFSDDSVEIGLETADANGEIQTVAGEGSAPAGVTFSAAGGEVNGLSIGTLGAGKNHGVWVKRVVTATSLRYADNNFTLSVKADTA